MANWAIRKAVWGYKLRVLFNRPYKNTGVEELRRRFNIPAGASGVYTCACGTLTSTNPFKEWNGHRLDAPCYDPDPLDGSEDAR